MSPVFSTVDVYHSRLQRLPAAGPPVDDAFVVHNRATLEIMCARARELLEPERGRVSSQTGAALIATGIRPDVVTMSRRRSNGAAWLTERIRQVTDRLNPQAPAAVAADPTFKVLPPTAADAARLSELHTAYDKLHGCAAHAVGQARAWKLCAAERVASAFVAERFQATSSLEALRGVKIAIQRSPHTDLRPGCNLAQRIAIAIRWPFLADPHSGCDLARRVVFHGDARWRVEMTPSPFPEDAEDRNALLQACSTLLPAVLAFVTSQLGELPPLSEFDAWARVRSPGRALEAIIADWETIRGSAGYEAKVELYLHAQVGAGLAQDPESARTLLRIDALPGRPAAWNGLIAPAAARGFDKALTHAAATGKPEELMKWLTWYHPNADACDRVLKGMIASKQQQEAWLPAVERIMAYGHDAQPATVREALEALYKLTSVGDVSQRLAWFRLLVPNAAPRIDKLLVNVRQGLAVEELPERLVAALGGKREPLEELMVRQATIIRPGDEPLSPGQVMIWKNLLGAF